MHYLLKTQALYNPTKGTIGPALVEIRDQRIAAVYEPDNQEAMGSHANLEALAPEALKHLPLEDLGQQMLLPGFIDAHVHFYPSSLIQAGILGQVGGATPEIVARQAQDLPLRQGWRLGIGWYASEFQPSQQPHRRTLDRYCSEPTMLLSGDAHSIWLNTAALEALGLNPDNVVTLSGQALVDEVDGQLTGTFLEAAAVYYQTEVFRRFHEEAVLAMQDFSRHLHAMGVTAVGDVAITGESPDDMVYPELYERALAQVPLRLSFFPAMRANREPLRQLYQRYRGPWLQMGGVKQFFDGVTSSHTAYLKSEYPEPYYPGDVGGPLIPVETQHDLILAASQEDWPMRIHAIGDRAIELTLTYYKEALAKFPLSLGKFHTIEHLEVMDWADLDLVAQEQLVVSVQPSHLMVGYDSLDEEVGPERAKHMFPFKEFLKQGATLAFGTDTPVVVNVTPLESLHYAVHRQTWDGLPPQGLMPEQRLTLEESLYAHTLGAAKALSRTDIGGMEAGMWADLVVLSHDLRSVKDWRQVKVTATYLAGQQVY